MSITYTGTITPNASFIMRDCMINTNNDDIYFLESNTPSLQRYNGNGLLSFSASTTVLAGGGAICMINNASAVITSSSSTNVDWIELSGLYRSNLTSTGGAALSSTAKGQQLAGDTSLGVAYGVTATANTLMRMVASTQTAAGVTLPGLGSSQFIPTAVILRTTGKWLVGGQQKIYEIDQFGNVTDQLSINFSPNTGVPVNINSSAEMNPTVSSMSMDNNLLLVALNGGFLVLYDWSTKTRLWDSEYVAQATSKAGVLSNSSSGVCLVGDNNSIFSINQPTYECDFSTNSMIQYQSRIFNDNTNPIVSAVMSTTTNTAVYIQGTTPKVRVLSVVPIDTVLRTFTVQVNGVHVKADLILLDDTTGTAKRLLDTYFQSPGTYRLPTGKTIIELVKNGEGANAVWDESTYTWTGSNYPP